jgi:hypothetical protein
LTWLIIANHCFLVERLVVPAKAMNSVDGSCEL